VGIQLRFFPKYSAPQKFEFVCVSCILFNSERLIPVTVVSEIFEPCRGLRYDRVFRFICEIISQPANFSYFSLLRNSGELVVGRLHTPRKGLRLYGTSCSRFVVLPLIGSFRMC
jgi:hypothetical protein